MYSRLFIIVGEKGNLMSVGLANVHAWMRVTAKNWMQYSADHVATTALLLSQNNLRSNFCKIC